MKAVFFLMLAACLMAFSLQAQRLYTLKQDKNRKGAVVFRHTGKNTPVISGHRGTRVKGIPENSIAAMDYVLQHTPAFFEIDPRITKDSVIVLMHDVTLDRTTTGTGKLSDYTWEELQHIRLKDHLGNVTEYRIPSLAEAIAWARGKTILNLDRKDVPLEMTAAIIENHQAADFVMVTVHSAAQARFYLDKNKHTMFSAFVRTMEQFDEYEKEGIPWKNMIAYIGADKDKPETKLLRDKLHAKGVSCMISAASTYDKLDNDSLRMEIYRDIIRSGTDILESDYPADVARALKELPGPSAPRNSKKKSSRAGR